MKNRFILRPWPFEKNEKVLLYWLESPFRTKNGWKFKACFKRDNDELVSVTYPWGIFAHLKMGYFYQDGHLMESSRYGEEQNLILPNISDCEICDAIQIPRWIYPLRTKNNLTEKCLKYTLGTQVILIPCLEIIRSLLTPTQLLAEAILHPQGLENLIDAWHIQEDGTISLFLSNRIPAKNLNEHLVLHIAWLFFNDETRAIWESVYRNLFSVERLNQPMAKQVKIAILFPFSGQNMIAANVVKDDKYVLVQQIKRIAGVQIPYEKIEYFHDSLIKRDKLADEEHAPRIIKIKDDGKDYYLDDQDNQVKKSANPVIVDSIPTVLSFTKQIQINPQRKDKRSGRGTSGGYGSRFILIPDENPNIPPEQNIVGGSEPVSGGEIEGIEFTSLVTESAPGLEKFIKTIQLLELMLQEADIQWELGMLPQGKSFSLLEDGTPRKYALVKIQQDQEKLTYVLEVARPDNRYLSTLVIWARNNSIPLPEVERFIDQCLWVLVDNNGSWKEDFLDNQSVVKISKMRHIKNQPIVEWAERIRDKIVL